MLLINKSVVNLKKGQKLKVQKCMINKQLTTESVQILGKHFPPTTSSMMVLPSLKGRTANAFCNAVINVLLDISVLQCPTKPNTFRTVYIGFHGL